MSGAEDLAEPCGNCDTCLEPVASFDGTEAAQKALSCIYRTGQIFGAGHLIDVLLGGDTEKIRKFRHQELSTYGIGGDFSREEWRSIFRQLVALGLAAVDIEGHGGLRLTSEARPVLRGERRIELRRDPATTRGRARPAAAKTRAPVDFEDPAAEALFQALRQLRLALAKSQGVPPYVIFHDSTLAEMARTRPSRLEQLHGITGIGQAKLERYGADFLAVINAQQAG